MERHDFYLVLDLEATCSDDGSLPRREMEIIEIGAVMVEGETLESLSEFQTFVRPVRNPVLTDFCTSLTSITQSQVNEAPGYREAAAALTEWASQYPGYHFCSWGNYDRHQFEQDSEFHQVPYPLEPGHTNIKAEFAKKFHQRKQFGMVKAMKFLDIPLSGTHHRGIDDARNIVKLLRAMMRSY